MRRTSTRVALNAIISFAIDVMEVRKNQKRAKNTIMAQNGLTKGTVKVVMGEVIVIETVAKQQMRKIIIFNKPYTKA